METSRLLNLFSHAAKDAQPAQDLSYVEEDGREIGVSNISPAVYEDRLGVPLSEVLKYPYLLASPELSEYFHFNLGDGFPINAPKPNLGMKHA